MNGVAASVRRVGLIAGQALREVARQRVFHAAVVVGLGLAGTAAWFRQFDFGRSELKFLLDFGLGGMALVSGLLAVAAMVQLFFSDVDSRHLTTVLAKPVRRWEWLVGRWLGVAVMLALWLAPLGLAVGGWIWVREGQVLAAAGLDAGRSVSYAGFALAVGLLWLRAAVIAAAALLVATLARGSLFALVVGLMVLAIGQLQHLAADAWARAEALPAMAASWLVARAFPNLQVFMVGEPLADGHAVALESATRIGIYGLGYVVLYLLLAALRFRHREL